MKDYVAMYEKKKEECLEKSKTLWARVGMSFALTDKEYQQFMELKDSPEIDDYVISLIQKGKARLDGNTYFPEYCNDNPEDEIEMELSGELFVDSKVMEPDVSDKKHHVLCNLYYQMDNDSMVIEETKLNLKRLTGIDEESISVKIAEARDAESEDFPADKNYWIIAKFVISGEKESIQKEIEDVMGFMSVDDIEIDPANEIGKEMDKNIKLTPDGAIGYIEDVSSQEWYKNPDITLYDEVEQSAYELFCDFAQLIGVHLVKTEPDFYFAKEISGFIMDLLEKEFKIPFRHYGESIDLDSMSGKDEKGVHSDDVVENLINVMVAYAMESGWSDTDIIEQLVTCGITEADFEAFGYEEYAKEYFDKTQNNIKNLSFDATEKGKELFVCPFTEEHLKQVLELDELSGNYVEQWIEDNEDYAWGLFQGDELVGYCTIGGADDCPEAIEKYDGYQQEDFLLSDVYIKPEYRRQGYGHQMVQEVLEHVLKEEQQNVFITLLYDGLAKFYEPLGFQWVDNSKEYCMVRDKRRSELKKEGTKMGLKEFLGYFDFDYDIVSPGSAYEQKIRQERLEDGNLSTEDMDKHLICLIDKQGANLGDVDKERYPIAAESVEKIIERMNVYIQDSVITEFEDALKERNVDVSDLYLEDMIMQCKILGVNEDEVCYRIAEAIVNPKIIYITEVLTGAQFEPPLK